MPLPSVLTCRTPHRRSHLRAIHRLTNEEIRVYAYQLLQVLAYLHEKGYIHRCGVRSACTLGARLWRLTQCGRLCVGHGAGAVISSALTCC